MSQRPVRPEEYPWWVRMSLLGSGTRTSQRFWVVFELVTGAILVFMAAGDQGAGRILLTIAAAWALGLSALSIATIRWIDRHGTWPR